MRDHFSVGTFVPRYINFVGLKVEGNIHQTSSNVGHIGNLNVIRQSSLNNCMEDIKGRTFLIVDTFECGPITATSDERGQTRINARRGDESFDKVNGKYGQDSVCRGSELVPNLFVHRQIQVLHTEWRRGWTGTVRIRRHVHRLHIRHGGRGCYHFGPATISIPWIRRMDGYGEQW